MIQINAYLHFNGNCREAMTFYHNALGGELTMQTVGESAIAAQMPAEAHNQIMHANLSSSGVNLMASDMMQEAPVHGNTISLMLYCSSEEEIRRFFEKLSTGGVVGFPLTQQFWGAIYGELTDKFGFRWLFNYDLPK
jgi:PhnB protein